VYSLEMVIIAPIEMSFVLNFEIRRDELSEIRNTSSSNFVR